MLKILILSFFLNFQFNSFEADLNVFLNKTFKEQAQTNDKVTRRIIENEIENYLENQKAKGSIKYFNFMIVNDIGSEFEILLFFRFEHTDIDDIEMIRLKFKFPEKGNGDE